MKYDYLKNIITFEDEFIDIQRTDDFDTYYLRTDTNYKIHNISARKMSLSNFPLTSLNKLSQLSREIPNR